MQYDPIKRSLGRVFNTTPVLRKLFYKMLDLLLLRTWHVRKTLRHWVKSHPGELKVLDAGMGFGQYSYYMASHYPKWKITGVDVKQEQVDDCNAFFKKVGLSNASFTFGDLEKFTHKNLYDLVISVDVMEHIPDDEAVFSNLAQALKPGGTLVVSTPSDQGGSDVHHHDEDHVNDGSSSFIDEHVRDGYSIDDITAKLKRAGFDKIAVNYTYGTPGKLSWKLSMKYPILMLNTTKLFFVILPVWYLVTFPFALLLNYMDLAGSHKTGTGLLVVATTAKR